MSLSFLAFRVVGHPEPAGSKKALQLPHQNRPYVVDSNPKSRGWKNVVASTARGAMLLPKWETAEDPVEVKMIFSVVRPKGHFKTNGDLSAEGLRHPFPAKKPDLLKLARGVEDAMTDAGVYRDDALIVRETLLKEWGEEEGVYVEVGRIEISNPSAETGFHVIHGPNTCYLSDMPHDDPTGCPTCKAKDRTDYSRCRIFGDAGLYAQDRAKREDAAA